jgi:hypothetical protein
MSRFFRLVALCLFPLVACGAQALDKPAVLTLPKAVEFEKGGSVYLSGTFRFRWEGAAALTIPVWKNPKTGKTGSLLVEIVVFDESDREVDRQFFVSMPPMPADEQSLLPNKVGEFDCFMWNGGFVFPKAGNYYAIATFDYSHSAGGEVIFRSSKTWFKAVEIPARPTRL